MKEEFLKRLLDDSNEASYVQSEVDETIMVVRRKTDQAYYLEKDVKSLKKKLEKQSKKQVDLMSVSAKKLIRALIQKIRRKFLKKNAVASAKVEKEEAVVSVHKEAEKDYFEIEESGLRYVQKCLEIIGCLEKELETKELTEEEKNTLLMNVNKGNDCIYDVYQNSSQEEKADIKTAVDAYQGHFVKKMLYSDKKGIAFCYYFPPTVETGAYVAARRLKQINAKEQENINWSVIYKDTTGIKKQDFQFKRFYADFVCSEWKKVGGLLEFNPKPQFNFAKRAMYRGKDMEADFIYSRSMTPASHLAAYMYKMKHPEVIWYAEFSDPVARDAKLESRKEKMENPYTGEEAYLNEMYDVCEQIVYEAADYIIFTNDVQKEFMLSYNPQKELEESINERALVWSQPILEKSMLKVGNITYKMDESKINIGYFGRVYKNRSLDDMLLLLKNEKVVLHIFALTTGPVEDLKGERVKVNEAQSYFNFVHLASKMDYVYLNDMTSEKGIIPWLPSKLSDYFASGAKIIGKYLDGSPMSMLDNEQLIKVKEIDDKFISSLEKREK